MIYGFRYRLYPTPKQAAVLEQWMEICRRLWNFSVLDRQVTWETEGRGLSMYDQYRHLTAARANYSELAAVPVGFSRGVLKQVDTAFGTFFRRCKQQDVKKGYPRYRPSCKQPTLINYDVDKKIWWRNNRIVIPKLGAVRARPHVEPGLMVKIVAIRKVAGRWYCSLAGDTDLSTPEPVAPMRCVGIDLGLTHYITTSDGEHTAWPRWYRQTQERRTKLQRQVARKQRGSANRAKAKERLARAEHEVACARETFLHELSKRLVAEYDLIVVEDLDVKQMLSKSNGSNGKQQTNLRQGAYDAGWSKFLRMLEHKCEQVGKTLVRVPARGTTQQCSGCGQIVPKTLRDRAHDCKGCGLVMDRDVNAARNILARGLERVGRCSPELTPVESHDGNGGEVEGSMKQEPYTKSKETLTLRG